MGWHRYEPQRNCLILTLHVQPGARRSEVSGIHGNALKLKVSAPPVENKANTALIAFLSKALGVQKTAITIRRGATGRRKAVEIAGGPELAVLIERLLSQVDH